LTEGKLAVVDEVGEDLVSVDIVSSGDDFGSLDDDRPGLNELDKTVDGLMINGQSPVDDPVQLEKDPVVEDSVLLLPYLQDELPDEVKLRNDIGLICDLCIMLMLSDFLGDWDREGPDEREDWELRNPLERMWHKSSPTRYESIRVKYYPGDPPDRKIVPLTEKEKLLCDPSLLIYKEPELTEEEWELADKNCSEWYLTHSDYSDEGEQEFENSLHVEREWMGFRTDANKRDDKFNRSLAVSEILDLGGLFAGKEYYGPIGIDFCDIGCLCKKKEYLGPRKRRKKKLLSCNCYKFLKGKNTWVTKDDQERLMRRRYTPRKRRKKILEWLIWDRSHSYLLPSTKYKGLFFFGEGLDGLVDDSFLRSNRSKTPEKIPGECERRVADEFKTGRTLRTKMFVFVQQERRAVGTDSCPCGESVGYTTNMVKMGLLITREVVFIFWLATVKNKVPSTVMACLMFMVVVIGDSVFLEICWKKAVEVVVNGALDSGGGLLNLNTVSPDIETGF
jgi:hypothetical protein